MSQHYDAAWVQQYFDKLGEREWERLVKSPTAQISLYVHSRYLRKYIRPGAGDRVLEMGAGAGRFTQVLAELGARIVVADLSPVQLDLNRKHAAELGFEKAVVERLQLDMCDMGALAKDSFDAVICYGGPLSYVFERRDQAMREMLRVLRPGGVMLVSVMSLWGTLHLYLAEVLAAIPRQENLQIIRTGDLCPQTYHAGTHYCHMYRAAELRQLLRRFKLKVEEMSACACLSPCWDEKLETVRGNPDRWNELLEMELEACRQPGALDMGTHLIAVARKPA